MAEQALVIEDYFSEGTHRVEQEEATPMNKTSDSGVAAASTKPGEERQKPGVVPEDLKEKNDSHEEQDREQQSKITVEEHRPPSPPTATEATDFLPFRRSVVETDTLLE